MIFVAFEETQGRGIFSGFRRFTIDHIVLLHILHTLTKSHNRHSSHYLFLYFPSLNPS